MIEFRDDRLVYYYHLQKPWGIPDEDGSREVLYKDIPKLPMLEEGMTFDGFGNYQTEEVYVPACKTTIVFVYSSYPERCSGPDEQNIYGPYLKKRAEMAI